MKPEYYCRQCREINPPDSGEFDAIGHGGEVRTFKPDTGPFCGACGSGDILPVDEWFAEKEAGAEGER